MLEQEFERLYLKFRLWHYRTLFAKIGDRDSRLSATESFAAEAIFLLNRPTVKEFAEFLHISQPNATYKINSLVAKGYVVKQTSAEDKREFRLQVTDKFLEYYGANAPFIVSMLANIRSTFSPEEIVQLENIIKRIADSAL